jgi:hypothetical protein
MTVGCCDIVLRLGLGPVGLGLAIDFVSAAWAVILHAGLS